MACPDCNESLFKESICLCSKLATFCFDQLVEAMVGCNDVSLQDAFPLQRELNSYLRKFYRRKEDLVIADYQVLTSIFNSDIIRQFPFDASCNLINQNCF